MNSKVSSSTKQFYLLKWTMATFGVMVPVVSVLAETEGSGTPIDFWLWQFFGRLHPMVVHFPISLLIFAGLVELFTLKNFNSKFRPAIQLLVLVGSISTLISALFGWLHANSEGISGETLDLHQQIGFITSGLAVILLYFLGKTSQQPLPSTIKVYRILLFASGLGVGIAGHLGASLTHGEDFLTEIMPSREEESEAPESITLDLASFASDLSVEKEIQLVTNVRSVLAHNCYKCHSGAKIEGKLRLDEKELSLPGEKMGRLLFLETLEKVS